MKTCGRCKTEKQFADFNRHSQSKTGYASWCRECTRAYKKPRERADALKSNYKMTQDEFDALAVNGCMACGSRENLVVDHDHSCCPRSWNTCGECVRGILCASCNRAEGYLKSDPNRAMALAAYMLQNENLLKEVSA